MSATVEPEFVGESRHAVVAGLLASLDEVTRQPVPRWVSLEAPSGWGKTRIAREFYARLAARQPEPHYWPESILDAGTTSDVTTRRKRVNPDVVHTPGSLPSFTWWGITCSLRSGAESIALLQDAAVLEAHAPYLEDAWLKLPRTSLAGRDIRALGTAVADEVVMEVGGRAVEAVLGGALPGLGLVRWLGEWGWGKAKESRERRRRLAGEDAITASHEELGDSLVALLTRLSRPGLPTVLFVEDLHDADPLLLEVIGNLLSSNSSVLVLSTGWPGHLDEDAQLRELMAAAGERLVRITPETGELPHPFPPGAGLGPLDEGALDRILGFYYPEVVPETAKLVVARYPNPLALELFCQIPALRRRFAETRLELSPRDLERLPNSIRDLYRHLWKELPSQLRQALAISTLGIPAVLDPNSGGSQWWNARLMAEAVAVLDLPDAAELASAMRQAPTAYAWARVVSETLRQFLEPDQLAVAGEERDELLLSWEADDIKNALAVKAAGWLVDEDMQDAERHHLARLLLALHSEGFVTDQAVVGAATVQLLELLREQPRELPERVRLAERALALLAKETVAALDIRRELGLAHREAGRWADALAVLEGLRQDRVSLRGREDEDSLADGFQHAAAVSHVDAQRCGRELPELLASARSVLGAEHPLTLRIWNLQAVVAWELDDLEECLRIDTDLLEVRRRVLGPEHRDTLVSASNLANVLIWAGRHTEALELVTETLQQRIRQLGPAHAETLLSRQELARLLGLMGRREEATAIRQQLFTDKEEALGPDHPATLWAQTELASALASAGRFPEAIDVAADHLDRQVRSAGESAADALDARTTLALILGEAGRPREALQLHSDVLELTAREFGQQHRRTLSKRHQIAFVRTRLVSASESLAEFEQLHDDAVRALGEQDGTTLEIASNLGIRLRELGRAAEGLALFEGIWEQRSRVNTAGSPVNAAALLQLAISRDAAGDPEGARELLGEHLPALEQALGGQAEAVVRLRMVQADLEAPQDPAAALATAQQTVEALADAPAADALRIDARTQFAGLLRQAGRAAEGVSELHLLVLDLLHTVGPANPAVSRVLRLLLDHARSVDGSVPAVLALAERVVDAARSTVGTSSPDFRWLLSWISTAAMGAEDSPEVLQWRSELVTILEGDEEPDEVALATARIHLGYGLLMAGDVPSALQQLVTGTTVLNLLEPSGPVTVSGRRLSALAAKFLGDWDTALEFRRQQVTALEADPGADPQDVADARAELDADLTERAAGEDPEPG
ncbi:hypothetical protein GCM10028820_23770 [Tessaracoccus terricola]